MVGVVDEQTPAVDDASGQVGFVHEARLRLAPGADERAPGGAVTVALCGHWEHDGSCRWPHHTAIVTREGEQLTLRVVAVSQPTERARVRGLIGGALAAGGLAGPGGPSHWMLLHSGPAELRAHELSLAARLAR